MMQNGPYEIRGDYSLFENPGRLSSQFVSCRITLGDRHLIRSYIEGFFQCAPSRRLFVYKSKASTKVTQGMYLRKSCQYEKCSILFEVVSF